MAYMLLTLVLQLALPHGLLLWLGFSRHTSHAAWVLAVVLVASLIVLLHIAGLWLVLPWYLPAASVFAPCSGSVVHATDGLADQAVPDVDREHMAGNHVILACGDIWVLLGHLQRGSVRVAAGDTVLADAPLGRVGNTGNTSEPHLHVHAQRPGTDAMPIGGEPMPIRFHGRYLARNDRFVGAR